MIISGIQEDVLCFFLKEKMEYFICVFLRERECGVYGIKGNDKFNS